MSRCAITAASASTGVVAARPASRRRDTTSSWRTLPQCNPRKNDPRVEGARTPPNSSVIPPWRSTSRSSMESAPAIMPVTIAGTFNRAFAPTATVTFRCRPTRPARSQRCTRRITGTSPAHDTRFGSSNRADVFAALCNNRISQMPFGLGAWGLRKHHHPRSEGICPVTTRSTPDILRWIEAQDELSPNLGLDPPDVPVATRTDRTQSQQVTSHVITQSDHMTTKSGQVRRAEKGPIADRSGQAGPGTGRYHTPTIGYSPAEIN